MSPYGDCHHTKYVGCRPCVHDAWAAGFEAAQREAQDAVAKIPLNSFRDGGQQAALIFSDGWRTGYDAALDKMYDAALKKMVASDES